MDAAASPVVGSLAQMPGADLLRVLARANATGNLRVGDSNPTWAALADGNLVVAGALSSTPLADELLATGSIDQSALADFAGHGSGSDVALLDRLATADVPDALLGVVRDHTVAAVFQMLLPSTEQFVFQPAERVQAASRFSYSVESILDLAQARVREWAEVATSVPSTQMVFIPRRHLSAGVDQVTVTRDDWQVLAVLDGRRTVSQVVAAVGRDGFSVVRSLHRLVQGDLIESRSDHRSVGRQDR